MRAEIVGVKLRILQERVDGIRIGEDGAAVSPVAAEAVVDGVGDFGILVASTAKGDEFQLRFGDSGDYRRNSQPARIRWEKWINIPEGEK